MWWKIILGVVGIVVIGFIGMVIKMAITDAKEETRDIEEASKKKVKEQQSVGIAADRNGSMLDADEGKG